MIIRQIGLVRITYEEQVAQHTNLVSLLSVAQKLTYRNTQVLAKQIQARSLDCGDYMNAGTQIESLVAAYVLFTLGIQILLNL